MGDTCSETSLTLSRSSNREGFGMPFREVSIVEQRREFIAFAVKDGANIRELCRRFGISRQTAYKWLERYRREGLEGLNERSRRPKTSPWRTAATMEATEREPRGGSTDAWGGREITERVARLARRG